MASKLLNGITRLPTLSVFSAQRTAMIYAGSLTACPTRYRQLTTSSNPTPGSGSSSKFVHMENYTDNSAAQHYGAFLLSQMIYRQTKRLMKSKLEFVHMENYTDNSAAQHYGALLLSQMIYRQTKRLMKSKLESDHHDLTVVEYGCATGSSSIDPLNRIQEAADGHKVKAVMNDLPLNDWDTLRKTLAAKEPNVEVQICSQSMYKGIVAPKGSVDLAYSCFTQHWLSKGVPCELPLETGALWGKQLAGLSKYKDIHEKWSKASRDDWARFLELRAEELRPGGIVVMHIQSAYVDGEMSAGLSHGCQVAKKQCLEEGIFTESEAMKLCIPEYGKNILEIVEPFASAENLKKWDLLEYHQLPGWALSEYVVDPNLSKMSQPKQARRLVGLARSFMESSLEPAFKDVNTSVRETKLNAFWEKVYEFGKEDSAKIDANFGATLLAFERK